MKQKKREAADYLIEREFSGKITVPELVYRMVRAHGFSFPETTAGVGEQTAETGTILDD